MIKNIEHSRLVALQREYQVKLKEFETELKRQRARRYETDETKDNPWMTKEVFQDIQRNNIWDCRCWIHDYQRKLRSIKKAIKIVNRGYRIIYG